MERLRRITNDGLLLISECMGGKVFCEQQKQNRVEFFGVEALDNCLT